MAPHRIATTHNHYYCRLYTHDKAQQHIAHCVKLQELNVIVCLCIIDNTYKNRHSSKLNCIENYYKYVQLYWLMPLITSTMLLVEIGLPIVSITFFIHIFLKDISHVPPATNNVYL